MVNLTHEPSSPKAQQSSILGGNYVEDIKDIDWKDSKLFQMA